MIICQLSCTNKIFPACLTILFSLTTVAQNDFLQVGVNALLDRTAYYSPDPTFDDFERRKGSELKATYGFSFFADYAISLGRKTTLQFGPEYGRLISSGKGTFQNRGFDPQYGKIRFEGRFTSITKYAGLRLRMRHSLWRRNYRHFEVFYGAQGRIFFEQSLYLEDSGENAMEERETNAPYKWDMGLTAGISYAIPLCSDPVDCPFQTGIQLAARTHFPPRMKQVVLAGEAGIFLRHLMKNSSR